MKTQNLSPLKSPYAIEKNLDKLITSNMKGESYRSPLNYHPKYLQDEISRMILIGNKNYTYGYPDKNTNIFNTNNNYFNSVQHKYLNKNVWNTKEENKGNNKSNAEDSNDIEKNEA